MVHVFLIAREYRFFVNYRNLKQNLRFNYKYKMSNENKMADEIVVYVTHSIKT